MTDPLQPTELADQTYFPLMAAKDRDWRDQRHFFAIASHAAPSQVARARCQRRMRKDLHASSDKLDLAVILDRLLDELAGTEPA